MEGVLFTFLCSLVAGFYFISNDIFKVRGDVFVFWRSLFACLILSAFFPFWTWGSDKIPYVAFALMAGALAGAGDVYFFNASKTYSAAAISRVTVSRNMILFFIWPFLVDGYWERLSSNPAILYGSIFFISISTFALFLMRKNPLSKKVIWAAGPVIVLIGLSDILFSFGMKGHSSWQAASQTSFLISLSMFLVVGTKKIFFDRTHNGESNFFVPNGLKAGAVNGLLFVGLVLTKAMALSFLENPGYFGAMVTLYTVWIYFLHRFWLKQEDHADPLLGFVVVGASIGLGVLSIFIPK